MKATKISKTAKKLLFIVLALACVALVTSCNSSKKCTSHTYGDQWSYDETNHWKTCKTEGCNEKTALAAHSFGDPVVTEPQNGAAGTKVYTCSVCAKTKTETITVPSHTHTAAEDWISDATMHWHACTQAGCSEKLDSSKHVWDNGTVISEALSGVAGEMRYMCLICEDTKNETIPALPEKMSEEDWQDIFVFDNVLVEQESSIGDSITASVTMKIDGAFAEITDEGEIYYMDSASQTSSFDFSMNYTDFNHLGNGVYYAKSILVTEEEMEMEFTDVTVVIADGCIQSISYNMEFLGFECELSFTFSMWGEVSVDVPALSAEDFDAALNLENFDNYTMDVGVFDKEGNYYGTTYYFDGNACLSITYSEDGDYNEVFETVENAGVEKNEFLPILKALSASDFIFDSMYGMFFYTTEDVSIAIAIEDGYLISILYTDAEGTEYYVDFCDYGETSTT